MKAFQRNALLGAIVAPLCIATLFSFLVALGIIVVPILSSFSLPIACAISFAILFSTGLFIGGSQALGKMLLYDITRKKHHGHFALGVQALLVAIPTLIITIMAHTATTAIFSEAAFFLALGGPLSIVAGTAIAFSILSACLVLSVGMAYLCQKRLPAPSIMSPKRNLSSSSTIPGHTPKIYQLLGRSSSSEQEDNQTLIKNAQRLVQRAKSRNNPQQKEATTEIRKKTRRDYEEESSIGEEVVSSLG